MCSVFTTAAQYCKSKDKVEAVMESERYLEVNIQQRQFSSQHPQDTSESQKGQTWPSLPLVHRSEKSLLLAR